MHDDVKKAGLANILDSSLLILSFPLFCYGMPAPLIASIDRFLPLLSMAVKKVGDRYEHVGQAFYSRLRHRMICRCGFPNSRFRFEPAVTRFNRRFPQGHTILTVTKSPVFTASEEAIGTKPGLQLVRQAGSQYAETGAIEAVLLAEITSPMIPEEQNAAIGNSGV